MKNKVYMKEADETNRQILILLLHFIQLLYFYFKRLCTVFQVLLVIPFSRYCKRDSLTLPIRWATVVTNGGDYIAE